MFPCRFHCIKLHISHNFNDLLSNAALDLRSEKVDDLLDLTVIGDQLLLGDHDIQISFIGLHSLDIESFLFLAIVNQLLGLFNSFTLGLEILYF